MTMKLATAASGAAALALTGALCAGASACTPPTLVGGGMPLVSGRLAFHRTKDTGSDLFVYDFSTHVLRKVSSGWSKIRNPLNPNFSADGTWITFTATSTRVVPSRQHIYAWNDSLAQPIDLTPGAGHDSEDSKFSFDGHYLVFKRDANIAIATVSYGVDGSPSLGAPMMLTTDGMVSTPTEASGPTLMAKNKQLYFFRSNHGAGNPPEQVEGMMLHLDKGTHSAPTVVAHPDGTEAYYPVAGPVNTLYFVRHNLTDKFDQVYFADQHTTADNAVAVPSNFCAADNSDPAPTGQNHYVFSSNFSASHYRLYYADVVGDVWDLSAYPELTALDGNLLGSSYTSH